MQRRPLGEVPAFTYVTAPNAATYRAIMAAFFEAKQHYRIELRSSEIFTALQEGRFHYDLSDEAHLEQHLDHLILWGNLDAVFDPSEAARLSDFYRKRRVFHLTPVGEAAHRAVLEVEATVGRSGSLQTTMLSRIRDSLFDLAEAGHAPAERCVHLLHDLFAAFDTLTEEASRFLADLRHHTQAEQITEERFALYKQALLAYISRFIEQLRRLESEIRAGIRAVREAGVDHLLKRAVAAADLPPSPEGEDPSLSWLAEQEARLAGVCAWFVGAAGVEPTVKRLADRAVEAIVRLTRALQRINERRSQPMDRRADFCTLARWFASCPSDEAAHQLYERAFGLYSARHFHFEEEDVERVPPGTSFFDAPPAFVPVRMRTHGSVSKAGRASPALDRSEAKRWLQQRQEAERSRDRDALRRFLAGPLRLGELRALSEAEFRVLLEFLQEVLSAPVREDGGRTVRTADGCFQITLTPPPGAAADRLIAVGTPLGQLRARDYRLAVTELGEAGRLAAASEGTAG